MFAQTRHIRRGVLVSTVFATLSLAACNSKQMFDGGVEPPPPTGGVTSPEENHAPSISGQPPAQAKVNQAYEFRPQASDPDGDALRFEITGRPSWATFSTSTGRLYGTPPVGATGTVAGIEIRVTDGQAKTALGPFSITISEDPGAGVAELSWSAPTQKTDGTPLEDLAGYRIYYGWLPDSPSGIVEVADPGARGTAIRQLGAGTWYFAISSYTGAGVESLKSRPVWKTI